MIIIFFVIIVIGAILNIIVINANDGKMPVKNLDIKKITQFHTRLTSSTKYKWLSDCISTPKSWYSPGDILMIFGVISLTIYIFLIITQHVIRVYI